MNLTKTLLQTNLYSIIENIEGQAIISDQMTRVTIQEIYMGELKCYNLKILEWVRKRNLV